MSVQERPTCEGVAPQAALFDAEQEMESLRRGSVALWPNPVRTADN
jgi:hypothetical protein